MAHQHGHQSRGTASTRILLKQCSLSCRFCDSPIEDMDMRTPKGRGKRGRGAAQTPNNDLSNFTETRSSVHSKLRNGGAKGRASRVSSTNATATPSTPTSSGGSNAGYNGTNSATAGLPTLAPSASVLNSIANMAKQAQLEAKRKLSSDDPGSTSDGPPVLGCGTAAGATVVNPVTGLNVQILPKKNKTTSPCAISPVLLECPEQFCSKKYKHVNGLRYHQSHAHGGGSGLMVGNEEDSLQQLESPEQEVATSAANPAAPAVETGGRSSPEVLDMVAAQTKEDGEDKKSVPTPMDTMDSRSNSSLNLSGSGVLRFSQADEADDTTMDSQKSGAGGDSGRHKKGRKSPGMGQEAAGGGQVMEELNTSSGPQSNRAEDVKSPAYSDISDDSTPVAESDSNREYILDLWIEMEEVF